MESIAEEAKKIIDDNFAEIQKNYFQKIKLENSPEYQNLLAELAEKFPAPEQYSRAIRILSNGLASNVEETFTRLQQEDFDDRHTHR